MDDLRGEYELGIGELVFDLRSVEFPLGETRLERDRAEQRNTELVGQTLSAAGGEELPVPAGLRVGEAAHVLDDAEYGHADLLEHLRAAERIARRDLLRRLRLCLDQEGEVAGPNGTLMFAIVEVVSS